MLSCQTSWYHVLTQLHHSTQCFSNMNCWYISLWKNVTLFETPTTFSYSWRVVLKIVKVICVKRPQALLSWHNTTKTRRQARVHFTSTNFQARQFERTLFGMPNTSSPRCNRSSCVMRNFCGSSGWLTTRLAQSFCRRILLQRAVNALVTSEIDWYDEKSTALQALKTRLPSLRMCCSLHLL